MISINFSQAPDSAALKSHPPTAAGTCLCRYHMFIYPQLFDGGTHGCHRTPAPGPRRTARPHVPALPQSLLAVCGNYARSIRSLSPIHGSDFFHAGFRRSRSASFAEGCAWNGGVRIGFPLFVLRCVCVRHRCDDLRGLGVLSGTKSDRA